MRRAFSLLLALLLLALPLAACTAEREEAEGGLQIVATNFPLYDFARRVAGEDASVRLLLSPGAEPHGYEPSPSDMKAILGCDLFLYSAANPTPGWRLCSALRRTFSPSG